MDFPIDPQKTLEIIERMKLAKIGEYKKWQSIIFTQNENHNKNLKSLQSISNFLISF